MKTLRTLIKDGEVSTLHNIGSWLSGNINTTSIFSLKDICEIFTTKDDFNLDLRKKVLKMFKTDAFKEAFLEEQRAKVSEDSYNDRLKDAVSEIFNWLRFDKKLKFEYIPSDIGSSLYRYVKSESSTENYNSTYGSHSTPVVKWSIEIGDEKLEGKSHGRTSGTSWD